MNADTPKGTEETAGRPSSRGSGAASGGARAARILVVSDNTELRSSIVRQLQSRDHECVEAAGVDEAQRVTAGRNFDLLLLNPCLPDGDGLEFAQRLQRLAPTTKLVIFTDSGSFRVALRAIQCGAIDYIRVPLEFDEIVDRVEAALTKSLTEQDRENRIRRLHRLCRELSSAREEIADQVDMLCNDLVVAYHELNQQIRDVAMASEFKTLIRQELDIEEVLRTMLEYLLTKTGPTNAAVFLPDPDNHYSLGAYVNYDCPRESIDQLLEHLCEAICPQMAEDTDLVAFDDADEFSEWIGADDGLLTESQVIAYGCHHQGECMAVVVLFRCHASPFDGDLAGTLDILRSIFAEQLAQVVRIHHRAEPQWPADACDDETDFDDGYGFGYGDGMAA